MSTFPTPHGARPSDPGGSAEPALATVHMLRALVRAVVEYGISAERFLEHAGVPASVLEDDSFRMPLTLEERVFRSAVALTGDAAFGLHWPERTDLRAWGPVSVVVAFVPNFRDLLGALDRYTQVFSQGIRISWHEREGELAIRFELLSRRPAVAEWAYSELFVAGLFRVLKGEFPHFVRGASFSYPPPPHVEAYRTVFGGKERFEAPHTEFVVDAALLELPRLNSNAAILNAAQRVADEHLEVQTGRESIGRRLREHLASAKLDTVDMSDAARALGLSVRSLRRRLTEEGLAWSSLLNEARAREAKQLLARLTIQEAAYELGFADSSAFHRAFKKWTGLTPAEFKKSPRGH